MENNLMELIIGVVTAISALVTYLIRKKLKNK